MGRQQFLTRLALGRSAFQDPEAELKSDNELLEILQSGSSARAPVFTDGNGQQYDTKGRPVNPDAELRKAEMRRAMNSILVLPNIVETDNKHRKESHASSHANSDLVGESNLGDIMDRLAVPCHTIATWFAECILLRYEAGLLDTQTPFLVALRSELALKTSHGVLGLYCALLPGASARLMHVFAKFGLVSISQLLIEQVSRTLWRRTREKEAQLQTNAALERFEIAAQWMCDILLLPLDYYAISQQLGVAPHSLLLPPMNQASVSKLYLMYTLVWTPTWNLPYRIGHLSSPAVLAILYMLAARAIDPPYEFESQHTMGSAQVALTTTSMTAKAYQAVNCVLSYLRHPVFSMRASCMEWFGYRTTTNVATPAETDRELVHIAAKDGIAPATTHRTSSLASWAPGLLATNLDALLVRLLLLPFESIVLNAVATSYAKSDLPKTVTASLVTNGPATRIGSTLFCFPSLGSWTDTFAYYATRTSKIGLAMAFQCAIGLSVSAGLYGLVRWQGIRFYGWGVRTRPSLKSSRNKS